MRIKSAPEPVAPVDAPVAEGYTRVHLLTSDRHFAEAVDLKTAEVGQMVYIAPGTASLDEHGNVNDHGNACEGTYYQVSAAADGTRQYAKS